LEKKGIPTVTIVTQPFHEPARLNAVAMGTPKLPLVVLPHPVGDLPEKNLEELAQAAYPKIVAALIKQDVDEIDYFVDYTLPGDANKEKKCAVCAE
jgi:hypothetical protein